MREGGIENRAQRKHRDRDDRTASGERQETS
jgi:hypothetical protein